MTAEHPAASPGIEPAGQTLAVLRNRPFLLLWLSQVATQIGGNMVVYGLTLLVYALTGSNSAVSVLFLTFLVPGVLFSALAGVYVDRLDHRRVLIATNLLRAGAFGLMLLARDSLPAIYLLNALVSLLTTFFAPAEAAMIPVLVARRQLVPANGLFTLTLNAAFALGCSQYIIANKLYDEDVVNDEARTVLRLHPRLAPFKVAVLPLSKKDTLTPLAKQIYSSLSANYMCDYDETQAIGRRYRRQDEIGTPLCVTVDFDSLEDNAVTIRHRDSTEQVRVPIAELSARVRDILGF